MNATILIGEPGIGKTTLAEALTAGKPRVDFDKPLAHSIYTCGVTEIGKHREGGYSGTDGLSLSVQPVFEEFIGRVRSQWLFFEGDRLANDKTFEFLKGLGYELFIYELWGPRIAANQRALRGSQQDPTWLAGRQTKVKGLRSRWNTMTLPAGQPVESLVARMDDPVSKIFKGG